jgi:hypothetical protein
MSMYDLTSYRVQDFGGSICFNWMLYGEPFHSVEDVLLELTVVVQGEDDFCGGSQVQVVDVHSSEASHASGCPPDARILFTHELPCDEWQTGNIPRYVYEREQTIIASSMSTTHQSIPRSHAYATRCYSKNNLYSHLAMPPTAFISFTRVSMISLMLLVKSARSSALTIRAPTKFPAIMNKVAQLLESVR